MYTSTNIVYFTVNTCNSPYPRCKWPIQCTECSCTCAMVHTRLQFLPNQAFLISASVMNSRLMQPCNSSHTMGSHYLGYELVLYTPIICHPVRILGNDYPGMGTRTVARLHKFAVHGCMHAAWWYICTWEHVAGMGICMQEGSLLYGNPCYCTLTCTIAL